MLRTLIIENNREYKNQLLALLAQHTSEIITINSPIRSLDCAKEAIQKWKPDLIILPTEFNKICGFELLNTLSPIAFQIIFTSTNPSMAMKAFQFSATDFLLQPISSYKLGKAIQKVKLNIQQRELLNEMQHFLEQVKQDKITLASQEGIVVLKLKEIIRLESEGSYTTIYYGQEQKVVIAKGLKDIESMLPATQFFRTHQSHLVNMEYIHKFLKEDGGCLLLTNMDKIPVARRRKEELLMGLLKNGQW